MENEKDTSVETTAVDNQDTGVEETANDTVDTTELEKKIEAKLKAQYEAEKQREIDKRVTEAVKKREAKLKAEQQERERLSKLSEEERLKEVQAQKEKELEARHRELVAKELKLDLVDILSEENLPMEFRDIIDVNKYIGVKAEERTEALKKDINLFKDTFNAIIEKKVEEVKREYLKGSTPQNIDTKATPISDYDKAKKNKDVKGMLSAKLYGANR